MTTTGPSTPPNLSPPDRLGSGASDYGWHSAEAHHMERRFLPLLDRIMSAAAAGRQTSVLDVGCGNGSLCGRLLERGHRVVGIDVSESGLAIARAAHPAASFEMLEADETILERLG